jgi:acetylornithine deacetylase/succinyl-diaminopimelate desuccinylase-like protein
MTGSSTTDERTEAEVVDLLQHLIRNACVNDGSVASGGEIRSADLLDSYLAGSAVRQRYEAAPGRTSLVARIEGSDPSAPSLMYLGHTDVVPANPDNWQRDPFGGELVDGEVWGRGAVDMLNLTASMAVAFKRLSRSGFKPRGTLIYAAVADEEALGAYGAKFLAEHELDALRADYLITESGGVPIGTPAGLRLPVVVGEKGSYWCRLKVLGTAGHASAPLRTDNALLTAAEIVRRIGEYQPPAVVSDSWRRLVEGLGLPEEIAAALLDPEAIGPMLDALPELGLARQAHAATHTTIAPTVVRGGSKTNVIPDSVELQLDIRTLPGQTGDDIEAMLGAIIGDLAHKVEVTVDVDESASESALDTPLWDVLGKVSGRLHAGAKTLPMISAGATDARFFRRLGTVAYGYGMFSTQMDFERFTSMFHGADERVDVDSLGLSVELFEQVAREFLG